MIALHTRITQKAHLAGAQGDVAETSGIAGAGEEEIRWIH